MAKIRDIDISNYKQNVVYRNYEISHFQALELPAINKFRNLTRERKKTERTVLGGKLQTSTGKN